jgi:hypothetical protein
VGEREREKKKRGGGVIRARGKESRWGRGGGGAAHLHIGFEGLFSVDVHRDRGGGGYACLGTEVTSVDRGVVVARKRVTNRVPDDSKAW